MALDPTVVALIGTVMGGVGLKAVEHYLGRNKFRIDDASRFRDELRLEITALKAENRQLEVDREKWRKDYYDQFAVITQLRTELQIMKGRDPP